MLLNENISTNKRIAKNTIFLYFRMLFATGVSLYTSRIVLDMLGVEDYGIYNVVGGIVVMFGFLNSSMSMATSRFLTFELGKSDYEKLKIVFSSALTIHFIIAIIILILCETVGLWWLENKLVIAQERMNITRWIYQLSIVGSMIAITQVPYNAAIIAHERMNVYAYVEILHTLLKLGIVFLLQIGNFDKLILYAVLTLFVTIIITIIYRIYCIRVFSESHYKFIWNRVTMAQMVSYSGWNMYQDISFIFKTQGINIILNMSYGAILNAAYTISNQVQGAVNAFAGSFLVAIRPQIIKNYATGNYSKMQNLVINASKFSFLLLFLIAFPMIVETAFILNLWLKEVPDYTVMFCRLSIVYVVISSSTNPVSSAIQATGKIKNFSITAGTLFLLVIPVSCILFNLDFSPITPMVINVIMISVISFIKIFIVKHNIPKFSIKEYIVKFVAVSSIIVFFSSIIPVWIYCSFEEGLTRFIWVCISFIFVLGLTTYYIALNKQMRQKICLQIYDRIRIYKFSSK